MAPSPTQPPDGRDSARPAKQRARKQPHPKLPKLPSNARIEKRPLFRAPIPSKNAAPSASSPKVVYVSARTPFVSAAKRVRRLLALADRRAVQARTEHVARADPRRVEKLAAVKVAEGEGEEVWIKGAGKCARKALQLGVWFQRQGDVRVRMRTGSVWAVDDVLVDEEDGAAAGEEEHEGGGGEEEEGRAADELPETRMRQVSVLEVGVSLK